MYKLLFLLLLIALVTGFSFALLAKNDAIKINTPVLAGTPILILTQ